MLGGLLSFYIICGLGAVANIGVGEWLFDNSYQWWLAGMAGAAVGSVWNYVMGSLFTWRKARGSQTAHISLLSKFPAYSPFHPDRICAHSGSVRQSGGES
jgi:putative flippase GtrA